MKLVRRIVFAALAVCLILLFCVPALAANASPSTQKLRVNGTLVNVQPYNIRDNNYFRLRDLAAALSGTGSRFSVGYDDATRTVTITTGEPYSAGGAGSVSGGAKDAMPSHQTVRVDGREVELRAYLIDDYNYFQLRELGDALGFSVDYDDAGRTMLVTTAEAVVPAPDTWDPDISFATVDSDGVDRTDALFASAKLTMVNYWAYWCGPCVREMPDLQRLSRDYADKGLQIVGISDVAFESDNIGVQEELGITYPCLRYVSAFDDYLQTGYVPTTIFVDGAGRVVGEVCVGSRSYSDWAAIIDGLLK